MLKEMEDLREKALQELMSPLEKLEDERLQKLIEFENSEVYNLIRQLKEARRNQLKEESFTSYMVNDLERQVHASRIGQVIGLEYEDHLIDRAKKILENKAKKKENQKQSDAIERHTIYGSNKPQ